jgi:hypothetical protein
MDSVSSSSSSCAGTPLTASTLATRSTNCVLLELQRRDVDGHRHRVPALVPQRGLAHGLAEHPVADGDDEAAVLGHRDEARRRDVAQLRVAPAQQGLGADDAAARQVDLRLVVQPESGR